MRNKKIKTDTDCGMTPAAFLALACGDEMNYLAAALPGGIERQEKHGQLKQAALQTLPIIGLSQYTPYLESLGFVFGKDADRLFRNVQFPEGWSKKPTNHSMWSDLVDEKGRKRGSIFYKAAFYDQSAHIGMERRYSVSGYRETGDKGWDEVCAMDGETVLKSFGKVKSTFEHYEAKKKVMAEAGAWLTEQFPGWDSEDAYKLFWD